ncbi:MAG: carbohydrate porin, partial [Geminicoccaceae bacterium]
DTDRNSDRGERAFGQCDAAFARAAGTLGLMWRPGFHDDLVGLAINIADPIVDGDDVDMQTSSEAFYRVDVSDNVAITADTQLLVNPTFTPDDDLAAVFGVRLRFNL